MDSVDKIVVRVCVGTTCYVLGGSELTGLAEGLPPAWRGRVDVQGAVCLDLCRGEKGKPPFVMIGDQVVDRATVEKVASVLRGQLA